jgi:hypothetical protein
MKESFDGWKDDLEHRASEIVEPQGDVVDKAVYDVAAQMNDAESMNIGERPIEVTIKQLEEEGWHYRGPISGDAVFEAVEGRGKEIRIVGTGTKRFLFEKEGGGD